MFVNQQIPLHRQINGQNFNLQHLEEPVSQYENALPD